MIKEIHFIPYSLKNKNKKYFKKWDFLFGWLN